MAKYILKGIVHPERAALTIGPIKPKGIRHMTSNRELGIELNIVLNQITIWVESEGEWNSYDLRNIARNFAATVCSVLSFVHGYHYEVEIIQILSWEIGLDQVFGIDVPCVSNRPSVEKMKEDFQTVLAKTGGSEGRYYSRCFKDLSFALRDTEDTAFYCYRALESLCKLCRDRFLIKKDSDQWDKIWSLTGFDRSYIRKLNDHANESRHGKVLTANEADRIEFLTRTWNVVEKFIENIDKPV